MHNAIRVAALLSAIACPVLLAHASVETEGFVITSTYPPDHLFSEIGPPQMPDAHAAPGTAVFWDVTLNQTLLSSLPSSLVLNLPDHAPVTLSMDQAQARGLGAHVWGGRGGDCSAVFTAADGRLLGDISCINGPYTLRMTASDTRLSFFVYPPAPAGFDEDVAVLGAGTNLPAGECEPQQSPGGSPNLDVLILYNAAVRQEIVNEGLNPQLEMQAIMDSVEQAMINSRSADAQTPDVNLVHAQEIAYAATGSLDADLDYLRDPGAVPVALRDQYGADVVMLVRKDDWQGYCGKAYTPGYGGAPLPGSAFAPLAVGVTVRTCGFAKYPFHHEFAHILGANHSETASNPTPLRCWAYAHYRNSTKHGAARTLVSNREPCGTLCAEVLNYSNADISVDWFQTGVPEEAENARVIAEFSPAAAAYGDSIDQIFANGFDF
ncbi:MAG: hypothetical protein EYC71_06250 [Gammaproteobacteria bacterium]|nr:MAG: hypothetical protein EYC71_06250 [Gammaproteobacteria bacterium]